MEKDFFLFSLNTIAAVIPRTINKNNATGQCICCNWHIFKNSPTISMWCFTVIS